MSSEVELPVRVVARLDEETLTTRLVGIVYKPATGAVVREVTLAVVGDGGVASAGIGREAPSPALPRDAGEGEDGELSRDAGEGEEGELSRSAVEGVKYPVGDEG